MNYGQILPADGELRKKIPLATGLLDFFPGALVEVAKVSEHYGRTKHSNGDLLCWDSTAPGHADCLLRHLTDRGYVDENGLRHSACAAWRALALLQQELEAAGACNARASFAAPQDDTAKATEKIGHLFPSSNP